jgi:hypothetical protein
MENSSVLTADEGTPRKCLKIEKQVSCLTDALSSNGIAIFPKCFKVIYVLIQSIETCYSI